MRKSGESNRVPWHYPPGSISSTSMQSQQIFFPGNTFSHKWSFVNDKMELRQNKLGGAVTKHSSAMKSIIKDWAPSAAEIRYVKLVHGPTASIPAKRQQSFRAAQGIIRRPRPPSVLPHFPLTRSVPPPGGPQISGSLKRTEPPLQSLQRAVTR
jgi:hypothetical protein